jgi:hypothetical protein
LLKITGTLERRTLHAIRPFFGVINPTLIQCPIFPVSAESLGYYNDQGTFNVLQLTGTAKILWDGPNQQHFPDAERLVQFSVR